VTVRNGTFSDLGSACGSSIYKYYARLVGNGQTYRSNEVTFKPC